MQLHERAGNTLEALRVYDRLAAVLEVELHTAPGHETAVLADQLSTKSQKVLRIN